MLLCLYNKNSYFVVINVIDYSIMGCNMTRIGNIISPNKGFWMSNTCTWMLHYIH